MLSLSLCAPLSLRGICLAVRLAHGAADCGHGFLISLDSRGGSRVYTPIHRDSGQYFLDQFRQWGWEFWYLFWFNNSHTRIDISVIERISPGRRE